MSYELASEPVRTMPFRAHVHPFSMVQGRPGCLHGTYSGRAFSPSAGSVTRSSEIVS